MTQIHKANTKGKPVAVVVGATSKWQSDGRNTKLVHGKAQDDSDLPVGVRWGRCLQAIEAKLALAEVEGKERSADPISSAEPTQRRNLSHDIDKLDVRREVRIVS